MFEDALGGTPRVQRLSLTAIGTPSSGRGSSPARDRSMAAARLSARSRITWLKACSVPSTAAIRSRYSAQTFEAVVAPVTTASRTSIRVWAIAVIR